VAGRATDGSLAWSAAVVYSRLNQQQAVPAQVVNQRRQRHSAADVRSAQQLRWQQQHRSRVSADAAAHQGAVQIIIINSSSCVICCKERSLP
jgi:hypothetical protein